MKTNNAFVEYRIEIEKDEIQLSNEIKVDIEYSENYDQKSQGK